MHFTHVKAAIVVSRAGPQNVMFTACFAEEATGPQWKIYWPVNNVTRVWSRNLVELISQNNWIV